MPSGAAGSTRSDSGRDLEPRSRAVSSCRIRIARAMLQILAGLRLPIREEVGHVHVSLKLGLFVIGEQPFVGPLVQSFDTAMVLVREVKLQQPLGAITIQAASRQIEDTLEKLTVTGRIKC